jgi:hypothetical protein
MTVSTQGSERVADNRKQAVSIRLGRGDIRKVKKLAARLGVRDSDVIRFALKWMLNRLAPLSDPEVRGRNLVPVFVEAGGDLVLHFDLDAYRLEAIINDGAADEAKVSHDDVVLLAMSGTQQPYLRLRLNAVNGHGATSGEGATLRDYLYEKYVYRRGEPASPRDPVGNGNGLAKAGAEVLFGALAAV